MDRLEGERWASLRRRGSGLLGAIIVEVLILIALLTLWPPHLPQFAGRGTKSFDIFNASDDHQSAKSPTATLRQRNTARVKPTKVRPQEQQHAPPPAPITNVPGMISLNPDDYRAADIGKIARHPVETADAGGGSQGDSDAIGTGPHGEPLYAAEWYREPTEAQTGPYIPKNLRGGAEALIACRTAPHYHVEDCVILGDNPPGTGLARGIRDAAFQFLVIPPRKGGKPLIGAWVRILFTIEEREKR
ncbi:MAG: hypothetical protein ACRCSO_01540 [Sphingomonas sp.]